MRGARGIEFGVDLPAIPAIGLGSVLPTSVKRTVSNTPPTAQGDGWGFGDWTRFVGAWKKSKSTTSDEEKTRTESQDHARDQQASPSSSPSQQSQPQNHETPKEKRARELLADDEVVRSSTDTLSVVFDWLIERVPAPRRMLGVGSTESDDDVNEAENEPGKGKADTTRKEQEVEVGMKFGSLENPNEVTSLERDEKELSALSVTYSVGHGVGSSANMSSSTSTSEIKRRMDSEKANLKKKQNELGSKDDLEQFYVALTRKMYDEGL